MVAVMLLLIGCQKVDQEEILIEKQVISLELSPIQEVRIIKPHLADLTNPPILITLTDPNMLDHLKEILTNAVYKDGNFEDILHDYEIIISQKDGHSSTIRYWVKFNRIEDENARNYIMDLETADSMTSLFKSLDLQ